MPDQGSAPSKTFLRSDGTRTGTDVCAQEAAIAFGVQAPQFDIMFNEIATALTNRWMVDGGTQPTADLPLNSFKFTGVGVATARTHYAAASQVQDSTLTYAATASNDTITATLSPAITAYAAGQLFLHKAGGTNTGAATLNENGVSAVAIKKGKTGSLALSAGDFAVGKMALFAHDGTNFQMLNAPEFETGTRMLFQQTAAPTGWTKDTTHNDKALRVVSGAVGTGGSVAFSTAFASKTVSGTTDGTAITEAQLPLHGHPYRRSTQSGVTSFGSGGLMINNNAEGNATFTGTPTASADQQIGGTGSGQAHTHTFTGTAINLAVSYIDFIIAAKD